ncbi:odorant receptor 33a-like [Hermetia illucens]|nr:odorant receptor 33a-like [Hermetia illucens]
MQCYLMVLVRKKLLQLENYFHILDENVIAPEDQVLAKNAREKGQKILKFFFTVTISAVYSRISGFLFTSGKVQIIPLWSPFGKYIVIKFLYDCIAGHLIILQTIASDMYPPICFLLLNAHLKILSQQLLRIGAGDLECPTQSSIAPFVEYHIAILKIYEILDATVSKMFFVELLIASILLCISTTSVLSNSMELSELMFTVAFTFALMFQILPICVLAHQFQSFSENLADAAYGSNWPDQDRAFRHSILLIMHRSQNCKLILAGGIVPINLPTFLTILRCAYSFSAIYSMMN